MFVGRIFQNCRLTGGYHTHNGAGAFRFSYSRWVIVAQVPFEFLILCMNSEDISGHPVDTGQWLFKREIVFALNFEANPARFVLQVAGLTRKRDRPKHASIETIVFWNLLIISFYFSNCQKQNLVDGWVQDRFQANWTVPNGIFDICLCCDCIHFQGDQQ